MTSSKILLISLFHLYPFLIAKKFRYNFIWAGYFNGTCFEKFVLCSPIESVIKSDLPLVYKSVMKHSSI